MGDSEEHAILLANYFNYIDRAAKRQQLNETDKVSENIHSGIVYGFSVPEGNCFYVIRRNIEKNYVELWNPSTGECYNFDREMKSISKAFG
jgi:hypothetical protein